MIRTDVLIVGAGPVGLTLALDLGQRGVRTTLVEQKPAPQFLPKMERCNARTMEIFRRMGMAGRIRAAGLAGSIPMDVYVVLAMNRPPLLRLPYPSVDDATAEIRQVEDASLPLEPYQLISQYTLEPLLRRAVEETQSVTLRFGCEFVSLTQDEHGVTAIVAPDGGAPETIEARYLVGCDGGGSPVRKQLGIGLSGEGDIARLRQALYYSEDLFDKIPIGHGPGRGRHYHVADGQSSFLIMQDSTRHWTLHAAVGSDAEMAAQFEKVVGVPVRYEMLFVGEWKQNLLLADSYGKGRVFLAGDSAHLVIPTGGLGMNTGVGDAADLGWKLAATLQGWGGPNLLRSYEVERRQVGDRNVGASRYASLGRRRWRGQYRPEIADATPAGQAARNRLVEVADVEQRKTNEMVGAELGYRYVDSPVICNEPGGPEHLFRHYAPTTWPGARLPHVWLDDATAIQDRIGQGFTLLRLGGRPADTAGLEAAMRRLGAPLAVLDVPHWRARDIYGCDLILLRPDMHVAWRGNRLPEEPATVAAVVTGH